MYLFAFVFLEQRLLLLGGPKYFQVVSAPTDKRPEV